MSLFTDRPALRWAVPGAAVALVAVAGVATNLTGASADASLAPRTAAQLLVDVRTARPAGLSGTVTQTSNLGLPELSLPGQSGGQSADLTSTITGTHTWRVWYGGPDKARLALLGRGGESDVIHNGKDTWIWSSSGNTAQHFTTPVHDGAHMPATAGASSSATSIPATPQEAADKALAAIDPTTVVTTPGTTKVAGRDAYELVLQPKGNGSLVAKVVIAIDASQHVPLRVQVFGVGTPEAAFEVGFSSVDFSVPDARQFTFNPPPGTTVTEQKDGAPTGSTSKSAADKSAADKSASAAAHTDKTVGTGWSAVSISSSPELATFLKTGSMPKAASMPKGAAPGAGSTPAGSNKETAKLVSQATTVLNQLPKVSGTWGSGRLFQGTVFSVLITDDGRVASGAVAPQALYAALSAK